MTGPLWVPSDQDVYISKKIFKKMRHNTDNYYDNSHQEYSESSHYITFPSSSVRELNFKVNIVPSASRILSVREKTREQQKATSSP